MTLEEILRKMQEEKQRNTSILQKQDTNNIVSTKQDTNKNISSSMLNNQEYIKEVDRNNVLNNTFKRTYKAPNALEYLSNNIKDATKNIFNNMKEIANQKDKSWIDKYIEMQKYGMTGDTGSEVVNKIRDTLRAPVESGAKQFERTKNWGDNLLQKPKTFDDGYQIGDVSKVVGSSVADAGMNIFNGTTSMVEGLVKLPMQMVAQVVDWTGNDEVAKSMRDYIADNNPETTPWLSPKINDWREKYIEKNSIFGKSSDQTASGIGSTIGSAGLQSLGSVDIGKLQNIPVGMGLAEVGNSVTENFTKEDVTNAQAWLNGAGKGSVSAISESIFGAFGVGGSELDDILVKKVTKNLNSQLAKGMAQLGIKSGGEASEEFLEYAGGYLTNLATDYISQGKGAQFYEEWDSDEVLQNMLSAFVSTGITQSGGTVSNLVKGNDVITGNTKQVQSQIDQEVQSQIKALEQKGEKVNTAKRIEIEKDVTEKVYLNNAKKELTDIINKSENIDKYMKTGILSKIESAEDFKNLNILSKMAEVYENRSKNLAPINKNIKDGEINSFIKNSNDTSNQVQERLKELKNIDTSKMKLLERKAIENEIKALENGYSNVEEYKRVQKEKDELAIQKAKQEYQEKELKKQKEIVEEDYRLSHRPTETGANASNISSTGSIPSDVYEHPEWYFSMSEKSYQESFNVLKKVRNNPEAEVKIYRASTKNELNEGDWITLSKTYAEEHNERSLDSKGKVYEYTVKAKDIQFAGDDINEFGYFPQEKKIAPIKEKAMTAIPIAKNINEMSNLTNNNSMNYNTNESIGEENGRQRNQRNTRTIIESSNRGRSKEDITNTSRKETITRYDENNISQKTIGEALTDIDSKKKTIDFAKKNKISKLDTSLQELNNVAKELGIDLTLYNGENGNEYIGLMEQNNMYLDLNENNISLEDGTLKDRFYHEVFHYLKRNTSFKNSIQELQIDIYENYNETINKYIESKGYTSDNIPSYIKKVLTEEMLADYCAKYMSGYKIDYGLSEQITYVLNQTVNDALSELKMKNRKGLATSSFFDKSKGGNGILPMLSNKKNINKLKNELRDIINSSTDMDSEMKNSLQKLINDANTEAELHSYKEDLKPTRKAENVPIKNTVKINNYKNAKLNSKVVNNALSIVNANKQGKRTKSQWLQVAEQIGMNIKENEIDKYAYKTWSDFLPNQKNNLNRQGERYVPFSRDEWKKAVEDGYYKANVEVKGITKEESQEIQKVIEDKDINSKSSDELWNELVNNSTEEAQELLDGRNIEIKQGRKNTKAISNDKSIEISKNGNMYLNNSKPTAEQYRNGLEYHFEKGEKRLVPSNKKQVQEGYETETWDGNQWVSEKNNKVKNESANNLLDEESSTLKYLRNSRNSNKASFTEITDALMQKFVNRGHYIDKLAKQTNNQELKFAYDKTLSTFAEAQYSIGIAQTDNSGNEIGKSLIDIFKPVKEAGLKTEFNDYLLNRLNIERQAVEKSIFGLEITSETSRNTIRKYEKQYPQFKEWANDVYVYNNNELQNLVDAGFISEDTQELFHNLYGDYVPIHRVLEETYNKASKTTMETGATSPIKRAKGGDQGILDIETAMAENVLSAKKSVRMNELGKQLAKSTGNISELEEIGYEPKWTPDAIISLNGDVILNEDGKYFYNVYVNGELKQFRITEELYEGLRKDTLDSKIRNNEVLNTLLTPIEKLTKAQRNLLTTYSVGFALNNPIKDFQDGLFYTKYSTREFLKNYTVAFQEIAKKGEYYKKYMALGGMDNSYFEYGSGIQAEAKGMKKLFNKIQKINRILETAPRLAEYITSIQNGATQNEAMYNAADITTNFKRGGEYTKVINKYGANFLNASVQGLDKFVRTFTNINTKNAIKLIVRVTSMGILPTLLNNLLYKDDDDYEKLENYIKDEYYLIKIGDDGDFIRIPKGRVLATISSATRTLMDGMLDGEFDLKGLKDEATKQLAPNNPLEDNLLAPVIQVANNKTWYGTDMVPSRLQNQLPKNQYNEKTDKISLWLGENLNISPIKINYLIDQYSGGIGDVILPMLTPQAENNIITDKFTTSSVMKNKTVGEFYDSLEEYEKLKNDSKATEEQKIKYEYLRKISSKVGELYTKKRKIQMDTSLTDKEKKGLVREVQREINAYTECAMDNVKKEYNTENRWNMYIDGIISDKVRESDGNSALQDALYIVNNGIATKNEYINMYQLCKDNDMSIPTMKTLVKLKNSNVKLTTYTDFKIGTKDYKSDKDEEDKTISGSLNAKKATYIMDMDVSKEQKNGLLNVLSEGTSYDDLKKLNGNYITYFKQSGKPSANEGLSARQKYMALINAGISVEELNNFYEKIGDIKALKNENGKTLSGSKKQLVFNFINSLKLSIPQKMILLAKQYKSFGKKYIKNILQYVTTLKMSKKDKIKLIYMLYKS